MQAKVELWSREQITVNTDPQRRCYDGHHFSSAKIWSEWEFLCGYPSRQDAEAAAATFQQCTREGGRTFQYNIREVTNG